MTLASLAYMLPDLTPDLLTRQKSKFSSLNNINTNKQSHLFPSSAENVGFPLSNKVAS